MEKDRREFLRLQVPADAEVLDEQGRKLGRVEEAGGGGLRLRMNGEATAPAAGSRLKITVVEPGTNHVIHTANVVVRYCQDTSLGLEFVSEGAAPGPA